MHQCVVLSTRGNIKLHNIIQPTSYAEKFIPHVENLTAHINVLNDIPDIIEKTVPLGA